VTLGPLEGLKVERYNVGKQKRLANQGGASPAPTKETGTR
jgi:hypothetical protein